MRYMGETQILPALPGFAPMNAFPTQRLSTQDMAHLKAIASTMSDEQAADLLELSDATPYGTRWKWIRIGGAAAAGLLVGAIAARALRR